MKKSCVAFVFFWLFPLGIFLSVLNVYGANDSIGLDSGNERTRVLTLDASRFPASGLLFMQAPKNFYGWSELEIICDGENFSGQFIPNDIADDRQKTDNKLDRSPISPRTQDSSSSGWIAALLPKNLVEKSQKKILKLEIRSKRPTRKSQVKSQPTIQVKMPAYSLTYRTDRLGGFPSEIAFPSGHVLKTMNWEDRLFDNDQSTDNREYTGVWTLTGDRKADLRIISDGPACTVVRQTARYFARARMAPSQPYAIYDWFHFKTPDGLVFVQARYRQSFAHFWKECHFLEFHINDGSFPNWQSGDIKLNPKRSYSGTFAEMKDRPSFNSWGAFVRENDFIALHNSDGYLFNDDKGHRIYIHADRRFAWNGWRTEELKNSCWLQIGTATGLVKEQVDGALDRVTANYLRMNRSSSDWSRSLANVERYLEKPYTPIRYESSDLVAGLALRKEESGQSVSFYALADKRTGDLFQETSRELFRIVVENQKEKKQFQLTSEDLWQSIEQSDSKLVFKSPADYPALANLTVTATIQATPSSSGIRLGLTVQSGTPDYRVLNGMTGGVTLANLGPEMTAIYPGGEGTIIPNACASGVNLKAMYPSLGAVMAWTAVWNPLRGSGLYVASEDELGGTKQVIMQNERGSNLLRIEYDYPMPIDAGNPTAAGTISGQIVWRAFQGDWYNATLIYRDWVRGHASWFPKLGPEGRESTPLWMRKLSVWGRFFGEAGAVVPQAAEFRKALDIPIGVHWYVWHKNPFDNDYPHYEPKEGFAQGVKDLQRLGCRVVPYTNGRLWDTRDREDQDWQFSSLGLKGACKKADGSPYTESYRSKEKDGSRVVFAAMCPGSRVWKDKVAQNVYKLTVEYGLDGVYMDQISCAAPVFCEDPEHGHSLRGGTWWTGEYRKLLKAARAAIPKERIFSSESNIETFADVLEGMVCWHIESENVVPAFSTIYSGVVFQYGRSYDTSTRAMLQKWGQGLVFGEQLGWFPSHFLKDPEKLNYFRPLIRFRHHLIDYFYKGEGIRPPKLLDRIPEYKEDWNIFGRFAPNSVPIVQTGARHILTYEYDSNGKRIWKSGRFESALLIFTNNSKETARSRVQLDWNDIGIDPEKVELERVDSEGKRSPMPLADLSGTIEFPPATTWGVLIHPKKNK